MVSNTLKMKPQEVIAALERLCREQGDDREYRKLRQNLPDDWPI